MSEPANAATWPSEHGVRCTDCGVLLKHADDARSVFDGTVEHEGLAVPLLTYACLACAAQRDAP